MRGTCRGNIQETAAYKKKQISKLNAEKKSNGIILTMVHKRKEQCKEAKQDQLQQQSTQPLPLMPLLRGNSIECVAEHQEITIVDKYWELIRERYNGYFSRFSCTRKQGAVKEQTNQVVRHQREGFAGEESTV
jgi:hypothetical protein